ncbi:MAG TPA: carbohydrate ABC transporter permease [Chloroflexota bacterium]|nr:carbohydrate ABC transporter permease [Chloroflexota bacterium]
MATSAAATATRAGSLRSGKRIKRAVVYATALLYLFVVLLPLYWMFRSSISENAEMYGVAIQFFPTKFTLAQFDAAWNKWHFGQFLGNTITVAITTTILTTIMASLAAFSLTRLRYPGRKALARSILFVYLIPGGLVFIPLFIVMGQLRLLNTLLSLIVAYQTFAIPFCTWMLIGYFKGIPMELEEAALIDGCTRLGAMWRVLLPLAAPGMVAAAIFTFTLAWNEFLLALVFINNNSAKTLPVGLATLVRGDIYLFGPMMAGSVMAAVPVMLLYMLAQRFVVAGLAAGAVKG